MKPSFTRAKYTRIKKNVCDSKHCESLYYVFFVNCKYGKVRCYNSVAGMAARKDVHDVRRAVAFSPGHDFPGRLGLRGTPRLGLGGARDAFGATSFGAPGIVTGEPRCIQTPAPEADGAFILSTVLG